MAISSFRDQAFIDEILVVSYGSNSPVDCPDGSLVVRSWRQNRPRLTFGRTLESRFVLRTPAPLALNPDNEVEINDFDHECCTPDAGSESG
ncbi:MAG: hypothetical protein JWP89_3120 [Schlesneria sp.]|nr:hypothetical protein [Schlesneria sp.]